jgi:hypothetical protein
MFEDEREFVLVVALDMSRWNAEDAVSQLLEAKEEILRTVERYEMDLQRERELEAKAKEEAVDGFLFFSPSFSPFSPLKFLFFSALILIQKLQCALYLRLLCLAREAFHFEAASSGSSVVASPSLL